MTRENRHKYTALGITFGPMFALIVSMMIITSCKEDKEIKKGARETTIRAEHFDYNGHQYIFFTGKWRDESAAVHDPECRKCNDGNTITISLGGDTEDDGEKP